MLCFKLILRKVFRVVTFPVRTAVRLLPHLAPFMEKFFLANKNFYYTFYYGSNNKILLFYKNLVKPQRFLEKVRYGQVFPVPCMISSWNKANSLPLSFQPSKKEIAVARELKKNGCVILPGEWPEFADLLLKKYKKKIARIHPSNNYETILMNIVDNTVRKNN